MRESEQCSTTVRPRGRRSRTLTCAGSALNVAGLVVLGHVGWELHGTTWLAQRDQGRTVQATQRVWSTTGGGSISREDRALAADVAALIRVPALGADYVVPAYRGTDDDTLARGFGIFDESPAPGAVGNLVLGGHRITHGEPLRGMPSLETGDEVVVETGDATYRYVLVTDGDSRTVGTDATWVVGADPVDPETRRPLSEVAGSTRLLTLVTCAEIFHTDDRLVAFARLVTQDPSRRSVQQ